MISSGFVDEKIFSKQQLYKVGPKDFQKVLHRSLGAFVYYDRQSRQMRSTGVLLSKNIVLVSASSLYNKQQNYPYDHFKFHLLEKEFAKKSYEVQRYLIPPEYSKTQGGKRFEFDYGLVKLKQQVNYNQFPQISIPCEKCLIENNKETLLEIYGYPIREGISTQKESKSQFLLQQYGLSKKNAIALVQPQKFTIGYTIGTMPGQIGSPVLANGKIIGIHIGIRNKADLFNIGRLFDKNLVLSIFKMCSEMKGKQFGLFQGQCLHKKPQHLELKMEKQRSRMKREYQEESFIYQEEKARINYQLFEEKKPNLKQRWCQLEEKISIKSIGNLQNTKSIKQLNLKCLKGQNFKLTSKQMEALSKVQLPSVTQINLQNNRITDKGLQIISKCKYSQLKEISLDDNDITINGLRFPLFNGWDSKVNYNLYSVQSNDNGYYLNVGESLPVMKKIVQAKNMNEVDYLIPTQKNKTLNAMNLLLQTPLEQQNEKQLADISSRIQKKCQEESAKNIYSLSSVLLKLKENLGESLNFIEKTSIQSNLSSKLIFTGLLDERVRFEIRQKSFKNYNFSDFRNNHKKLLEFTAQYMEHLRKKFGVQTTDMTIDRVVEGSIIVNLSDSLTNASVHNKSFFKNIPNNIKLFFEKLRLAEGQFDEKGNYQFPKIQNAELQVRGGFPYYQPVLGKRFGIRVNNLYDKGNNNWLMMNGNKDQWAIAFHGTPNSNIRSIMDGRLQGNMLKQGIRQACRNQKCLKNNSAVGAGIYASPYFLDGLIDYSNNQNDQFYLVLQCRAKPASIKIPQHTPNYWVINNREQLRPYGIILFTKQDVQLLRGTGANILAIQKKIYRDQQLSQTTWNNVYKQQYLNFINKP